MELSRSFFSCLGYTHSLFFLCSLHFLSWKDYNKRRQRLLNVWLIVRMREVLKRYIIGDSVRFFLFPVRSQSLETSDSGQLSMPPSSIHFETSSTWTAKILNQLLILSLNHQLHGNKNLIYLFLETSETIESLLLEMVRLLGSHVLELVVRPHGIGFGK